MPRLYEDDVGQGVFVSKGRASGICTPRHCIGATLNDVKSANDAPARLSKNSPRVGIGDLCPAEEVSLSCRRSRQEGRDPETARVINMHRPSSSKRRPESKRIIDFIPTKGKHPEDGSKRCFDDAITLTGYENPIQYDAPTVPGLRPTHPVTANGVVSLDRRRIFPGIQNAPTGIPPQTLCKLPSGSQWGGWGRNGAPGRLTQFGPWDSMRPSEGSDDVQTAQSIFSDARKKSFPAHRDVPTFDLTTWHVDARNDVDRRRQLQIHLNETHCNRAQTATLSELASASSAPSAGKPSGLPVEGARLHFYDNVRAAELAFTATAPQTAR
eukprot:TRINITY_DN25668_c0_g1_i1.p1 TRINITY_DN25668_c0_g1~~TRINITY_DN25668_c0_g1_i1.p1  ORF type:complete len:326 (-),score=26.98 TRINITY_DN25668_c0_g1_i1:297-1274(-)